LIGSRYYVAHLTSEQLACIHAMVNLDSLGIQPTKVFLSHSSNALFDDFEHVADAMKLPADVVNVRNADEDSEPFAKRGVPTLMLHSVTPPSWRILHSPQDTFQAIDMSAYYDSYHLIAAYLAYLDNKLD
jgi:Zn-dependent M28 family amino/carboxypeptidase